MCILRANCHCVYVYRNIKSRDKIFGEMTGCISVEFLSKQLCNSVLSWKKLFVTDRDRPQNSAAAVANYLHLKLTIMQRSPGSVIRKGWNGCLADVGTTRHHQDKHQQRVILKTATFTWKLQHGHLSEMIMTHVGRGGQGCCCRCFLSEILLLLLIDCHFYKSWLKENFRHRWGIQMRPARTGDINFRVVSSESRIWKERIESNAMGKFDVWRKSQEQCPFKVYFERWNFELCSNLGLSHELAPAGRSALFDNCQLQFSCSKKD